MHIEIIGSESRKTGWMPWHALNGAQHFQADVCSCSAASSLPLLFQEGAFRYLKLEAKTQGSMHGAKSVCRRLLRNQRPLQQPRYGL